MRALDRPIAIGALATLGAVLFAGALLMRAGGDPSRLVQAGNRYVDPVLAPPSLTIQPEDEGFDGQFFYRLARSPLSTADEVGGIRFDIPAYRSGRVGYPSAAWLLSGGGHYPAIPWALLLVNVLAVGACGWAGAALARSSGAPAWWGLVVAAYPGFAISMSLDLAEPLTAACLLVGLLAFRSRQSLVAAAALTAAVLTRETALLVPFGLVGAAGWFAMTARRGAAVEPSDGRVQARELLLVGAVPIVSFVAWQLRLRDAWGEAAVLSAGNKNITIPFGGLADELDKMVPTSGANAFRLVALLLVIGVIVVAATRLRDSTAGLHEKLAWLGAAVLPLLLQRYVWAGATSFLRATTETYVLSWLIVMGRPERLRLPLAAPVALVSGLTAVAQLGKV